MKKLFSKLFGSPENNCTPNDISSHPKIGAKTEESDIGNQIWGRIINEYLDSARSGALVICGEWGSGKTHLFKNEISPTLKSKRIKTLYVSLYSYGIQSRSLDDLIIQAALGITELDENAKQEAKDLFTQTAIHFSNDAEGAGFFGALASSVGGALKKRYIDSLADYLICFDDLDRVDDGLVLKAWAEINHLTEIKHQKTIILVDERKLPGKSIYSSEIEKNVWRKFSIHVSPELAMSRALEQLPRDFEEEIRPIISTHLLPVAEHFSINNIRILVKALEVLIRVKECIVDVALEGDIDQHVAKAIYQKTFIAILIQHISEDKDAMLDKICDSVNTIYRTIANMNIQNSNAPIREKGNDEHLIDNLPPFSSLKYKLPFIAKYIKHGKLEAEDIRGYIRLIHKENVVRHPIYLAYEELSRRGQISDEEYEHFFRHCVSLLQSPPPGDYSLRAYATLIMDILSDSYCGATTLEHSVIAQHILNGLEVVSNGIDTESHRVENFDLLGLSYSEGSTAEVNEKISLISRKVSEKKAISEFFSDIDGWELESDLKKFRKYMGSYEQPTLSLLGFDRLRAYLCNANGNGIANFNMALTSRYRVSGSVHVIGEEVDTLTMLLEYFEKNTAQGYRKAQFNIGISILRNAIDHASRYKRLEQTL